MLGPQKPLEPDLELVLKALAGAHRAPADPDVALVALLAELSAAENPETKRVEVLRRLASDARSNTY